MTRTIEHHGESVARSARDRGEATAQRVAARFEALIEKARGLDAAVAQQRAKLHGRTWNLSLAPEAYAGSYTHPLLGEVTVTRDAAGDFVVRWGRLHGAALPYDDTDTMRVELVPNSGSVVAFDIDERHVERLRFEGMTFTRRR